MIAIVSGRMHFHSSFADMLEEFRLFPDKGDMRSVRPSIRSMEMTLRRSHPAEWIAKFWSQALSGTQCIDPSEGQGYTFIDTGVDPKTLYAARDGVIERFRRIGLRGGFASRVGSQDYLRAAYGMDAPATIRAVRELLGGGQTPHEAKLKRSAPRLALG